MSYKILTIALCGARVITNIVVAETTVYLLSIYDKGEKETLSDAELKELLKFVL